MLWFICRKWLHKQVNFKEGPETEYLICMQKFSGGSAYMAKGRGRKDPWRSRWTKRLVESQTASCIPGGLSHWILKEEAGGDLSVAGDPLFRCWNLTSLIYLYTFYIFPKAFDIFPKLYKRLGLMDIQSKCFRFRRLYSFAQGGWRSVLAPILLNMNFDFMGGFRIFFFHGGGNVWWRAFCRHVTWWGNSKRISGCRPNTLLFLRGGGGGGEALHRILQIPPIGRL